MSNDATNSWINTYTGKKFHILNPTLDEICIEDIAHALSQLNRFTGHSIFPYSIGQHCLLVSDLCSPKNKFTALMHDSVEAYINDISRPLKQYLPDYKKIELDIEKLIAKKFNLEFPFPEEIHIADAVAVSTEARDLMPNKPEAWILSQKPRADIHIKKMSPKHVEQLFLEKFYELSAPNQAYKISSVWRGGKLCP